MKQVRALIAMVMLAAMLALGGSAAAAGPGWGGGGSSAPTPPCPFPWTQMGERCVKVGITTSSGSPASGAQVSTWYLAGH